MKEEKFKNLKLFLAMLGIFFSLPAMAENYVDTLHIQTPDTVLQAADFVLTPSGQIPMRTWIRVKNGVEFYIQLPENHQVGQLDGGVLEGDRIRVSSAGSLGFRFILNQARYVLFAHVNYFGVLQYAGGDAPGVIEVTGDISDSCLYVENSEKFSISWAVSLPSQNNFIFLHDISILNIDSMQLKEIVLKAKMHLGEVKEFDLRVRFSDGTSNALADGITPGGRSDHIVAIKDGRVPQYTVALSASPAEGGSVSGGGTFEENTVVTVVAVANPGWHFLHWQHNGTTVSSDSSYSFAVTDNTDLVAVFGMGSSLDELPPATTRAVIADGRLSIYSNSAATVALYDMHGRVLLRSWIEAGATTIPLDIPRGTYFVKVNEKTYKLLY